MPKYGDVNEVLATPSTAWVLGFLFNESRSRVILIQKTHPEFQRGRWNGVGGKIEPNETILDAMTREFEEETGVHWKAWHHFCSIRWNEGTIYCYKGFAPQQVLNNCHTVTDERISQHLPHDLSKHNVMPNLYWMVALAACPDDYKPIFIEAKW